MTINSANVLLISVVDREQYGVTINSANVLLISVVDRERFYNILEIVKSFGIMGRACISDIVAENRKVWKEVNVSEAVDLVWIMSPHKTFFFADVPQLIKLICNLIINNGITTPVCNIDKSAFNSLFVKDCGELFYTVP